MSRTSRWPRPKNMVDQYDRVARNHDEAQYFANVTNLDAAVGKLLKALKSKIGPEHIGDLYIGQWTGNFLLHMDPARVDPSGWRSSSGNETLDDGGRIPGHRYHVLACTDQARSGKWRSCISFGLSPTFAIWLAGTNTRKI